MPSLAILSNLYTIRILLLFIKLNSQPINNTELWQHKHWSVEPQFWIFFFEVPWHSGCALAEFQNFGNNLTALPLATPQLQHITDRQQAMNWDVMSYVMSLLHHIHMCHDTSKFFISTKYAKIYESSKCILFSLNCNDLQELQCIDFCLASDACIHVNFQPPVFRNHSLLPISRWTLNIKCSSIHSIT